MLVVTTIDAGAEVVDVPGGAAAMDTEPDGQDADGPCTFNIQCGKNKLCIAGQCAATVPCASDKQCTAVGLVCNAAAGHCVACLTAADCAADQACKANQCLAPPAPCASSKQCATGLVCDPALKVCVECAAAADCGQGFACIDTVCALPVCQAGAESCASPTLRKVCKGDGSGYLDTVCASDAVCEDGACKPLVCEPASATCVQSKRSLCNANGTASNETPCAADQVCLAGACVAATCKSGDVNCESGQLLTCKPDGGGWATKPCGTGQVCSGKACVVQTCAPGKAYCDGAKAMQCNPGGTATQLVGDCATATQASACVAGACVPLACTPGSSQCADVGTLSICKADGSGYTQTACGANAACEAGACKAKACAAGSIACVGANLQTCKADGNGWDVKACDDNNICTADSCDPKTGCINKADDSLNVSGCYTGDPATKGKGACKPGLQACNAGKLEGSCLKEVVPNAKELCDGVDDDCDGQTDEGCTTAPAGMVFIPAGTFWMGCNTVNDSPCQSWELPQHKVTLSAYYIDVTEVTAAEYMKCVDAGECGQPGTVEKCNYNGDLNNWGPGGKPKSGREQHPVNCVNSEEAQKYCQWRGAQVDAANASKFDLPTEAQWEMAARGDCEKNGKAASDDAGCKAAMRRYPWGNAAANCKLAAIVEANVAGCGANTTLLVGSKPAGASPYGLLDAAGNVSEWTRDWYDASYYSVSPSTNPLNKVNATYKAYRGGSAFSVEVSIRSAFRGQLYPKGTYHHIGFRCARSYP